MANAKIPPELKPEILKLYNSGKDSEDIASWLWLTHKVEVTSRAVRRFLKNKRDETAAVAKVVVREELRKHVLPCVDRLVGIMRRARKLEREAEKVGLEGSMLVLKAQDRQMKAANLLLHYSGLNQPDRPGAATGTIVDARQALFSRIEALASKALAEPKTDPPVH